MNKSQLFILAFLLMASCMASTDGSACCSDGNCASRRCRGGRCCSLASSDYGTTACDNTGTGIACGAGCRPVNPSMCSDGCSGAGSFYNGNAGSPCSCDSQCQDDKCESNRCCKSDRDSRCNGCDVSGDCTSCTSSAYLRSGQCYGKAADGGLCVQNAQCFSTECRTGHCCVSGRDASCQSCDLHGLCTSCAATHYLNDGQCFPKRSAGGSCNADMNCVDDRCRAGHCCLADRSTACTACNNLGGCIVCVSSTHYLYQSQCYVKRANGLTCQAHDWCSSGACRGGYCCQADRSSLCATCDASALCTTCVQEAYLDSAQCYPKKAGGGSCTARDDMCESNRCIGNICCKPGTTGLCTVCDGSGTCSACLGGHFLHRERCCLDGVSTHCSMCSEVGWCLVCDRGWFLSRITCLSSRSATASITTTLQATQSTTLQMSTSSTVSNTISRTETLVESPSRSETPTLSPSPTRTMLLSDTLSPSPTLVNTETRTVSETSTLTLTASVTPPATPSRTSTQTLSMTETATQDVSDSATTTGSFSDTTTVTASMSESISGLTASKTQTSELTLTETQSLLPAELTPAPSRPPGAPCDPAADFVSDSVAKFSVNENTIRYIRQDFQWNATDEIIFGGRWADRRYPLPRSVNRSDFSVQFAFDTLAAPSDSGVIGHASDGDYEVYNTSLYLVGGRYIDLAEELVISVGPFADYDIQEEELLRVFLTPKWFLNGSLFCGNENRRFWLVAEITIVPEPEPLFSSMRSKMEGFGSFVLIASTLFGSSASADVVSTLMLSESSCARPAQRSMFGGSNRVLSPLQVDGSAEGMLWGNLLLGLVGTLAHCFLVYAPLDCLNQLRHIRGRKAMQVMAKLRFPAVSLALCSTLHPGVLFLSVKTASIGDHTGYGESGSTIGIVSCFLLPILMGLISTRIDSVFMRYDFDAAPASGTRAPKKVHRTVQLLLPFGQWEPSRTRRKYGVVLSPFARDHRLWFLAPMAVPSFIALVAGPISTSQEACTAVYLIIFLVTVAFTILMAIKRPYRSHVVNVLVTLSSACVALVALGSTATVQRPNQWAAVVFTAVVTIMLMVVATAHVAYIIIVFVSERTILKGVGRYPYLKRQPMDLMGEHAESQFGSISMAEKELFFDDDIDGKDVAEGEEEEFFDSLMQGPESKKKGDDDLEMALLSGDKVPDARREDPELREALEAIDDMVDDMKQPGKTLDIAALLHKAPVEEPQANPVAVAQPPQDDQSTSKERATKKEAPPAPVVEEKPPANPVSNAVQKSSEDETDAKGTEKAPPNPVASAGKTSPDESAAGKVTQDPPEKSSPTTTAKKEEAPEAPTNPVSAPKESTDPPAKSTAEKQPAEAPPPAKQEHTVLFLDDPNL